ncbi:RICIN domain-containing protein [Streptomyces sp. NRRL F-4428]|uniref:RICIN domain-containing protein n=1 Tax=Streptomyces sp. NRRL F-4428 TaxID=1609137 RepID=UPI00099C7039|nr:ricin-type beta-trefoil lectin domain protein [Streptomyces sp. NRRL F-4428]
MKRIAGICASVMAFVVMGAANAGSAQALNAEWYEPWHNVAQASPSKCITPEDNSTANGTVLTVWSCTGSALQDFKYINGTIRHQPSGKCVTPRGDASDVNGAVLTLWTCTGSGAQKFSVNEENTATVQGSKCVTSKGGSLTNGVWMTLWTCAWPIPVEQAWS